MVVDTQGNVLDPHLPSPNHKLFIIPFILKQAIQCTSVCLSVCLSLSLSVFLFPLSVPLYVYLSVCLSWGVVGYGEGVAYLTSLGCPFDTGLQLGKAAILVAGKGIGEMFLLLLFLHFDSFSSFFPVPLFHLLYYIFYLFSTFLGDDTK